MSSSVYDPAFWSRLQFAFTLTYHYLFPQLTMGLAWFLVYWKWRALRTGDEKYNQAVRFWAKIFGLNAAKLYNIDVKAKRNALPPDTIEKLKTAYLENGGQRSNAAYGWVRATD